MNRGEEIVIKKINTHVVFALYSQMRLYRTRKIIISYLMSMYYFHIGSRREQQDSTASHKRPPTKGTAYI